jgi:hypothetical protein
VTARTVFTCPVRVTFSVPDARSHTLMVRSADPVTNHSLPGSTAAHRTHPRCPEMTRISFQGACHLGLGTLAAVRRTIMARDDVAAFSARAFTRLKSSVDSVVTPCGAARAVKLDTSASTAAAGPAPPADQPPAAPAAKLPARDGAPCPGAAAPAPPAAPPAARAAAPAARDVSGPSVRSSGLGAGTASANSRAPVPAAAAAAARTAAARLCAMRSGMAMSA